MPAEINSIIYKDEKSEGVSENRTLIVVNGVPFYSSTGTSVDRETIVGPSWRAHLWMPFVGVETSSKLEGKLIKLGGKLGNKTNEFENQIKKILSTVLQGMEEHVRKGALQSLLIEKYRDYPDLDDEMILSDLAQQLTRFGTFEAMIISMNISPKQWEGKELLKGFMQEVKKEFPEFMYYATLDLPKKIEQLKLVAEIKANLDDLPQTKHAAIAINNWLLDEANNQKNIENIPGSVDNSSFQAQRPAACPRDPGNLNKSETGCTNRDLTGSRGQAAGRRELNCQQTPISQTKILVHTVLEANSEIDRIQELLCDKLSVELSAFKKRKGVEQSEDLISVDKLRYKVVEDLKNTIIICSEKTKKKLSADNLNDWEQTYQKELSVLIKKSLKDKNLDKYNVFEKLLRSVLNLVTAILFPIALYKKNRTGTYFFSTGGKTKDTVDEADEMVEHSLFRAKK
jgi:hypothetical protein